MARGFHAVLEHLNRYPEAVPGGTHRVAWWSFKRIFSTLIQHPVWSNSPQTISEWEHSFVPSVCFDPLKDWIPATATELLSSGENTLPIDKAFDLLELIYPPLRRAVKSSISNLTLRSVVADRRVPAELPGTFQRSVNVEELFAALRSSPPSIHGALLHGSLADGMIADGFSDADVLCIISNPAMGERRFWRAAQWLFRLNRHLFAINPCMHHGPMIGFEDELTAASEASLPSAVLKNGCWLKGAVDTVHYHDGLLESLLVFEVFETYFEEHHLFVSDLKSAFDALWWVSNSLILPVLYHQFRYGASIYKRRCLESRDQALPAKMWAIIDQVAAVRLSLGSWINENLPSRSWENSDDNPGRIVLAHQDILKLTPAQIRAMGLDDRLMAEVRQIWEWIANSTRIEFATRMQPTFTPEIHLLSWHRPICRSPRFLAMERYDAARNIFVERCRSTPSVRAVFEFGSIGCPGLSDLDFCVVLEDEFTGIPQELTAGAFADEVSYIMDHDPLFVSVSMLSRLSALFPIFQSNQILGSRLSLPPSRLYSFWVRAAAITHLNLQKYPNDLDYLIREPALNVRTIMAFLHSAHHIKECLGQLGIDIDESIVEATALDIRLRENFSNGKPLRDTDVLAAVTACLSFCEPVRKVLTKFWISAARQHCVADLDIPKIPDLAATKWTLRELSGTNLHGDTGSVLSPLLDQYISIRNEFVDFETKRGRRPSVYIADLAANLQPSDAAERSNGQIDSRVATASSKEPRCSLASLHQLGSKEYKAFMAELNAFAENHGLRQFTTWSKIWEYPWLWLNGLAKISWKGKHLLDLGSEISPMPWFLGTLGARVRLIETDSQWIPLWIKLKEKLGVDVQWDIVTSEILPVPDETVDVVTSFSVIEHQPNKSRAIGEITRILKPGGHFAISFDICEPQLGMTFPTWNGKALTLSEFEERVWMDPAFGHDCPPNWNTSDISPFLTWHRTTAPHHNYIVGASILTKQCSNHCAEPVFFNGWHAKEQLDGEGWWRWCSGNGDILVRHCSPQRILVCAQLFAQHPPDTVTLLLDGIELCRIEVLCGQTYTPFEIEVVMTQRTHRLSFKGSNPASLAPNDSRPLAFAIRNLQIVATDDRQDR